MGLQNFIAEKPSLIPLLLNNSKLPPFGTDTAAGSYLGKPLIKDAGRSHLIVKCSAINLREIMKGVTV